MNRNSNLSPLPWYETIEEQGFRKFYAYDRVWPLIAHRDRLLPFQIPVRSTNVQVDSVRIYNLNTGASAEISVLMSRAGLTVIPYDNMTNIVFPANTDLQWSQVIGGDFNFDYDDSYLTGDEGDGGQEDSPRDRTEGRFYLEISCIVDGLPQTFYSEVMTLVLDLTDYLRIDWYSNTDITYQGGRMLYQGVDYINFMYLYAEVAMPEYTFEEEGEEREGFFFATRQTSEKTYRFSFLATEEVCDALRIVGLSDMVMVTDTLGRVYLCDKFLMTPEWMPQGYLAAVTCEFQTNTVVIQRAQALSIESRQLKVHVTGARQFNYDRALVAATANTITVTVYPMYDRVTASAGWLHITKVDVRTLRVDIDANTTGAMRDAFIAVGFEDVAFALTIQQMN